MRHTLRAGAMLLSALTFPAVAEPPEPAPIPVEQPSPSADAAPAAPPAESTGLVTVELKNGEKLTGTVVESTDSTVTLDHPSLGRTVLNRDGIASITPILPPPPPKVWSGSVELGLNGSAGNTEALSFHTGIAAKRTLELEEFTALFRYDYTNTDGETTVSKGRVELRNDWMFDGSQWRIFAKGTGEYDQFQDWDWRASAFAGLGYQFIKSDQTSLLGRIGAGISREFGGEDDRILPEGLLGLDLEHRFTEHQRLLFTAEYLPDLSDIPGYRIVARATYEIVIDPTSNLSLKLGAEDTYDSSPGEGKNRNDLTYFAALVFSF